MNTNSLEFVACHKILSYILKWTFSLSPSTQLTPTLNIARMERGVVATSTRPSFTAAMMEGIVFSASTTE